MHKKLRVTQSSASAAIGLGAAKPDVPVRTVSPHLYLAPVMRDVIRGCYVCARCKEFQGAGRKVARKYDVCPDCREPDEITPSMVYHAKHYRQNRQTISQTGAEARRAKTAEQHAADWQVLEDKGLTTGLLRPDEAERIADRIYHDETLFNNTPEKWCLRGKSIAQLTDAKKIALYAGYTAAPIHKEAFGFLTGRHNDSGKGPVLRLANNDIITPTLAMEQLGFEFKEVFANNIKANATAGTPSRPLSLPASRCVCLTHCLSLLLPLLLVHAVECALQLKIDPCELPTRMHRIAGKGAQGRSEAAILSDLNGKVAHKVYITYSADVLDAIGAGKVKVMFEATS